MRKILKVSLFLLLILFAGCEKKIIIPKVDEVVTVTPKQGGVVSTFMLEEHEIHLYQPANEIHSDVINYAFTAPLLLVFGDEKLEAEAAVDFICSKGIDTVAQNTGASIVFVNPITSWDKETAGTYEKVISITRLDQKNFENGLLYVKKTNKYYIYSPATKVCVYGYGKGADYIAQNYLKPVSGISAMSYMTSKESDLTFTAAVLENLSVTPEITDPEIIIASINNSNEINKAMESQCNHFITSKENFAAIYDQYIRLAQRADGKIVEAEDKSNNGLVQDIQIFEMTTSEDNHKVKTPTYTLGALVYRKENSTAKKRPLVMLFHGGGDTALLTSTISGWTDIALQEDFILCAIENHVRTTPTEVMDVIDRLEEIYNIDPERIYATGFSMGGSKTWDLYQEYPERFAAMAPMAAGTRVGRNTQTFEALRVNQDVLVPVFVTGGESSILEELPFQGRIPLYRVQYVFQVNQVDNDFEMNMLDRSDWPDTVYGYPGDIVEKFQEDETHPRSVTTIRYYKSFDGNIYTALVSISLHDHEIRPYTCQKAWEFMSQYKRNSDGKIVIEK